MALFNSSMEKNIIKAPQGTNYLSDIISELPVNCLFNKGKTGCGGTELVLRGTKNAIIAVPYISLIQNKLDANSEHGDRRDEILGFYGEVDETEVRAYLSTHSLKKIIVTYDSLPKLVRIIGEVEGDGEKGLMIIFYWWMNGIVYLNITLSGMRLSGICYLSLRNLRRLLI